MSSSAARAASAAQVRAALLAAAQVGPFFRLEVCDESHTGWLPVGKLDRSAGAGLVAHTARELGTDEMRVAASILQAGLAARIWSPVLGSGLLMGVVPDLSGLAISAEPPVRLGVVTLAGWLVTSAGQLARLSGEVAGAQLAAIAAVLPEAAAIGLLRGNSASAMTGALGVLVRARPELSDRAVALAHALLHARDLHGTGQLGVTATGRAADQLAFRRRSCCLYYRLPGGGLCGDCCFTRRPG